MTDEQFAEFLAWIDARFPGWTLPRLLLTTKALTGCRLADICGVRSDQLQGGKLAFRADQTKGRKERKVPLPADLFEQLCSIKGPVFLWENYPVGLREALTKRNFPTHQLCTEFSPRRLYHWIETLFSDYTDEHPDKPRITSHMLRKRAFTAAWEAGIDARKAAIAIGCNPDTMMKHYVRLDEQAVTDEVMSQLAGRLGTATPPAKAV
jgi:integrase